MSISTFFDTKNTKSFKSRQKAFKDHMDDLKSMSVREITFYKKWKEVQKYKDEMDRAIEVKNKIWRPTDINDREKTIEEIKSLDPKIKMAKTDREKKDWEMLRVFCHSMNFDQSPGRFLKFIIYTEVPSENPFIDFDKEERYLGAVSMSSDVISLGARDEYIGWNRELREEKGMLNHTSIASCIMSTQPFGYNFLGGKLVASLVCSPMVREAWEEVYGNELIGITTTSLYGSYSMYNGIKYWKKVGKSKGEIFLKPDQPYYNEWHQWLKKKDPDRYDEITDDGDSAGPATGVKQGIITEIFKRLGLKSANYKHGFQRGVYFSMMYKNGNQFLREEIDKDQLELKEKFKKGRQGIVDWWTGRAIRRYKKLLDREDREIKPELMYYTDIIGSTWKEAKQKHFDQVGR